MRTLADREHLRSICMTASPCRNESSLGDPTTRLMHQAMNNLEWIMAEKLIICKML